jgi:hypothetical protein
MAPRSDFDERVKMTRTMDIQREAEKFTGWGGSFVNFTAGVFYIFLPVNNDRSPRCGTRSFAAGGLDRRSGTGCVPADRRFH